MTLEQEVMFINRPLSPAVIFDLDGTLCDHRWRIKKIGPRVEGANPQKRFEKYHSFCDKDKPVNKVLTYIRNLHIHNHIIICTGRPIKYRKKTEAWLSKYQVPYKLLMMRGNKDFSHGWKLKLRMIQKLPQLGFLPKMIYDDEIEVIQMAKALKLQTFWMKGKSWKL